MNIQELRDRRERAITDARRLIDRAEAENRDLTRAEADEFDRLDSDARALGDRLERLEKVEHGRTIIARFNDTYGDRGRSELADEFRRVALSRSSEPLDVAPNHDVRLFAPAVEARALATGTDSVGVSFWSRIWAHAVETSGVLRAGASVLVTETGEELRVPISTADSTAEIVAEGQPLPESDPTLSSVSLPVFKYAALFSVSNELLQDERFDLEGHLAMQAGRSIGRALAPDLLTGDGTTAPAGVLTGATLGKTGEATAPTGDDVIDLEASVLAEYAGRPGSGYVMAPATLAALRKSKASTAGTYLLPLESGTGGARATLWGQPVYTDSLVPAADHSAKSVLFGDFGSYLVRQAGALRFERSEHFRFANDQTTFRVVCRYGAGVLDASALKYFQGVASGG